MAQAQAESMLARGGEAELLEGVVSRCEEAGRGAEVLLVEALVPTPETSYAASLNAAMARALNANVVLTARADRADPDGVAASLSLVAQGYGGLGDRLAGAIINRVPCPEALGEVAPESLAMELVPGLSEAYRRALEQAGIAYLGLVPSVPALEAPRVSDVLRALDAEVLIEAGLDRRVHATSVAAMTTANALQAFAPGTLVVTPSDRADILCAAAVAEQSGLTLAGVLVTGELPVDERVLTLCRGAYASGLPLIHRRGSTLEVAQQVLSMDREVPVDDRERARMVMHTVAAALGAEAPLVRLAERLRSAPAPAVTTPAFRHNLIESARRAGKRIVLPEGDEPRTLLAASICARRGVARCVLLGNARRIVEVAGHQGIGLDNGIDIIDPSEVLEDYVEPMVQLRAHKGLHADRAREELHDPVVLGTMMLQRGEVDGLVAGAVHTTAQTLRPALQLIRTAPGYRLVSSVFFMGLPGQVLVYGDCAVNPDPTAEELAEIAIQSADSALAFGIPPRVAMLSYATLGSGSGKDVEKVHQATEMARARRPDLLIDGPLQYDAAFVDSVGRAKAPGSQVAGRATVFVFPDLNTGNTTYKAVQRSAGVISMGPMLQGLAKPVNDLSRGALVEDIVFTIALTAVQAAFSGLAR